MTIAILPARLANQIAAGEVVERPASVIKELIENSLDAGATTINIDVDKGGVKRIRIADNGKGIVKDELMLALSRHATSKIKNLADLEAIDSLGFRGEALASISSVSRLTLTSKPQDQEAAWQAYSEGRDMQVTVKPAAHPNGTTIEVLDLFFNTPARRKFLRTEKTEFAHIDEVVRRIALARFDVAFVLTHNSKVVRQYRIASDKAGYAKRVAMVCGQKFIEHAIEIDCPHDNMKFSGWLAKPSFSRSQNDLCYSYVNGRMMRDKLINHAIRQAYADLLPKDTYPAFVLFLELDYREVDVNVHPAKHEVRFHQSRYVHDFIYSVCHKALLADNTYEEQFLVDDTLDPSVQNEFPQHDKKMNTVNDNVGVFAAQQTNQESGSSRHQRYERADYIKPLEQVSHQAYQHIGAQTSPAYAAKADNIESLKNYRELITPLQGERAESSGSEAPSITSAVPGYQGDNSFFLSVENDAFGLFKQNEQLKLLSLISMSTEIQSELILKNWQQRENGLVSQPLLLPVLLNLSVTDMELVSLFSEVIIEAGIVFVKQSSQKIQIRQFPACLREQDVSYSFHSIIKDLATYQSSIELINENTDKDSILLEKKQQQKTLCKAIGHLLSAKVYTKLEADILYSKAKKVLPEQIFNALLLNSVELDLTSAIKQLSN